MRGVLDRVRTDRRVAIGLVLAILFLIAWIAWAVFVWNENGSAAGIGVLVSWPAVLAMVASPFVAVAWFLRKQKEGAADTAEDEDEGPEDDEDASEGGRDEADEDDGEDHEAVADDGAGSEAAGGGEVENDEGPRDDEDEADEDDEGSENGSETGGGSEPGGEPERTGSEGGEG